MPKHDLVVIGAGSGNMVIDDQFTDLDVAIVEERKFGGTCVNYGCIPSKMLAYTADVVDTLAGADDFHISAESDDLRWTHLRDRVFGRTDEVSADGAQGRRESDFITVYDGHARFTGPRRLAVTVNKDTIEETVEVAADRIVVAAGGRPVIPPPVQASGLPYETSNTIMRVDAAPRRLAVLGGGYIAAELAHIFAAAGSEVTIVEKSDELLGGPQDEAVRAAYTQIVSSRCTLKLRAELTELSGAAGDLVLRLDDGSEVRADMLLVATGRTPNSDRLDVDNGGIDTHEDGRIVVDDYLRTTADGVYALGDVSTPVPLKHVANREAETVKHNLLHPDDLRAIDRDLVPSAVFTNPQIASIGLTEEQCRDQGRNYVSALTKYSDVAYGWAMQDETGLCKVLVDTDTDLFLGAHVMGAQAATLVQIFVIAMQFGITVDALAHRPYWIHPALTEVVENTLLDLADAS